MRWLVELFRPDLRCARVGHVEGWLEIRRGFIIPSRVDGAVADSLLEARPWCPRCGLALGDWREKYREHLIGLTMPERFWNQLEAKKELWYVAHKTRIA